MAGTNFQRRGPEVGFGEVSEWRTANRQSADGPAQFPAGRMNCTQLAHYAYARPTRRADALRVIGLLGLVPVRASANLCPSDMPSLVRMLAPWTHHDFVVAFPVKPSLNHPIR